jgi:hypothetical protein
VHAGYDSAERARFDPKGSERVKLALGENARWADISGLGRLQSAPGDRQQMSFVVDVVLDQPYINAAVEREVADCDDAVVGYSEELQGLLKNQFRLAGSRHFRTDLIAIFRSPKKKASPGTPAPPTRS